MSIAATRELKNKINLEFSPTEFQKFKPESSNYDADESCFITVVVFIQHVLDFYVFGANDRCYCLVQSGFRVVLVMGK